MPLDYIFGDDGSFTILEDKDKSNEDILDLQAERAPATLLALLELRAFSLGVKMLDFVERNRLRLVDRLIQKPYFTNKVLSVCHELDKIPEEEIIMAKQIQLDSKEQLLESVADHLKKHQSGRKKGAKS